MTLPPSLLSPARPDLADRLLAAVAERDQPMAERLVQQWVHRRGLEALEALMAGPLLASQGAEAVQWMQERVGGGVALTGGPFGGGSIRNADPDPDPDPELESAMQLQPEWVLGCVEQVVEQGLEPADQAISHPAWHETACEKPQELPVLVAVPASAPIPAAVLSHSCSQLAVVPDGGPAPASRALAPLRAWLPDADRLPLAS